MRSEYPNRLPSRSPGSSGSIFSKVTKLVLVVAVSLSGLTPLAADVLYLRNGRQIEVERFWREGNQIFYERNGGTFGFPSSLLDRAERDAQPVSEQPEEATNDEPRKGLRNETLNRTIDQARQTAREGDLETASRLYRQALTIAPDSVTGRVELAELFMSRGNLQGAQIQLEQAKRLSPEDGSVREKLGDVYYRRGRTALAIREWQKALTISPSATTLDKLKQALRENDQDIDFDELRRPHFLIRYDGAVNEAIGREVAAALDTEYNALVQEFHFSPQASITVTLYTNREFRDVTDAPSWVAAVNDGELRIPVQGLDQLTPGLRIVLRHELTHSFIIARTRGKCPTWFHEGLAQFRSGESSANMYDTLRKARDDGSLFPLWSLEGSFLAYSKSEARLVYMESLAAIEYVVKRKSRSALARILDLLADRRTMNDALRKVIGLDYQEFQTAWEADLDRYRPRAR